jgi:Domain of unknown function (DUF4189)
MGVTAFQRRIAATVVGVAAVAAMSATMAPRTSAAPTPTDAPSGGGNYYGAIAWSLHLDEEGYPQVGGALNLPSQTAAESAAVEKCGVSDCAPKVDFQDCAIAAWDASLKQLFGAQGPTLKAAAQAVLTKFPEAKDAQIVAQGCNKGSG